jgi:hypothetical protein
MSGRAIGSIPAIFAVITDPFIVYTSNVFAILGLRSLYFALAGVMNTFHYLKDRHHHSTIDSSNNFATSSPPAGRGDNPSSRCCASVPSTSAGRSAMEYPTSFNPRGIPSACMKCTTRSARMRPASLGLR